VTQNESGTAPGSQGVFRGKGVGSDVGARQLFGSWDTLSSCRDKRSSFFYSSEIKTQSLLRLNNVVYSTGLINKQGSADFVRWFFESKLASMRNEKLLNQFTIMVLII
jgi:hypothetical protein